MNVIHRKWYWISSDDFDKAIQILEKIPKQSVVIYGNRFKLTDYQQHVLENNNIRLYEIPDDLW